MSKARIVSGKFVPSKEEQIEDYFRVIVRLGFRAPKDVVGNPLLYNSTSIHYSNTIVLVGGVFK